MPALQDSHIVKIAVELENQTAQLIEFDQRSPLTRKLISSHHQRMHIAIDECLICIVVVWFQKLSKICATIGM